VSQVSRRIPKPFNLDRLKSRSKRDTNETPTCAVVHAPQTNALWWGEEGGTTKAVLYTLPRGQAFWQRIQCPGQFGTRSWDHKTESWLSHSHHWVCPEHAGPRHLFSCWCSQMNFWKLPFLANGWVPNYPTPLGKSLYPLHQKPSIRTRVFMFCRVGSWVEQCPSKKESNHGHLLLFKFEDLSQLLMDLRLKDPTLQIKVTE